MEERPRLTLDAFVDLIDKYSRPGDWYLTELGFVRARNGDGRLPPCPICWLATKLGLNPSDFREAFDRVSGPEGLDLSRQDVFEIVDAADGRAGELRDRLLKACKLAG